jgi:tetratricopeptide (TPR) repeat protein
MATLFARRAERLLGAGLQDLASGDLERALTLDPDCVAAWKARARWWESLGRWDDAVNDGSEALSRNPTDADALEARARAWDALGRTACAAADRALVARIEQQSTWSASPRVSQESPR